MMVAKLSPKSSKSKMCAPVSVFTSKAPKHPVAQKEPVRKIPKLRKNPVGNPVLNPMRAFYRGQGLSPQAKEVKHEE